jgi:hypothetical protein
MPVDEALTPTEDPTADVDAPVQESDEAPNYGEWNEELPQQLQDAIKNAVKEFEKQETYDRRREVLRDRRNRFYERGFQHVYEDKNSGTFQMGVAGGMVTASNGDQVQCPNYIDDYNIYGPFCHILQSVHTQNPPGIDFQPKNPSLAEDMDAAETAEGYRKLFDRANDTKKIQTDIIRMMLLSGRTIVWTRTEADGQKFGLAEDGTPKRCEVATVYGTLESKVPILAKSQEECLYVILSDDPDVKTAKAKYPDFADKIKPGMSGLGESAYERIARLGVMQGNRSSAQVGDVLTHLVTRANCFLRPAAFIGEMYNDPFEEAGEGDVNEDGGTMTVRDKLNQLFPLGCHAVFVGDVYVGSQARCMDDAIGISFPFAGDGMHREAIMDAMVVVQDRYNDNMNAAAEVWDHGWPSTWVNADDTEYDAIVNQRADPYAIRQKKARSGVAMEAEFFREPDPELPETFMQFTEMLQGPLAQFIVAAPPALFGAAMDDQKTASGYAQARNQAMGTQAITWAAIQKAMATMYYQAALCAADNPDYEQDIVVPNGKGTQTIQLQKLTKGNFGAYPDEDSSFPETTMQKRQTMTGLVTMAAQSPMGAAMFESPDNWELMNTLMGLPELVLPQAEARDKQIFEIEILLEQSSVPPSPEEVQQAQIAHAADSIQAQATGAPEQPFDQSSLIKPSIMPDELDFHQFEFEKCKEWLSSSAARRQLANGNVQGVQNVKLHALAHQQMMIAQMPPPMPMPAPAPGKKAGPPPAPAPPNPNVAPSAPTM